MSGRESPLRALDAEILRIVVEMVRQKTGVERWRFVQVLDICSSLLWYRLLYSVYHFYLDFQKSDTLARLQGGDEHALVDFTTLRHTLQGTIVQVCTSCTTQSVLPRARARVQKPYHTQRHEMWPTIISCRPTLLPLQCPHER